MSARRAASALAVAFLLAAAAAPAAPGASGEPRADRVRAEAARIRELRDRAAAPGIAAEGRDGFTDAAWDVLDAVLEDPALRDEALRTPAFLQQQALLLLDGGEPEEALEPLQRLGAVAPGDPETHYLLGLCLGDLGRHEESAKALRRALELGVEGAAEARARLAWEVTEAGRPEEGLAEADRAVAADPAEYYAHFVLGKVLARLGRPAEARRAWLAAVGLYRDDADLWGRLGEAWEREGDRARALECYREAVRVDPSDEAAAAKVRELARP